MSLDAQSLPELAQYLDQRPETAPSRVAELLPLGGGVSSSVVWVRLADGRQWVVKQALAKLRVRADWRADPGRAHIEAMALRWFAEWLQPGATPALIFEDEPHNLLCMQAVADPGATLKAALLQRQVDPSAFPKLGAMLAALHVQSHQRLAELAPVLDRCRYIEALRIEPYYLFTAAQLPQADALLQAMAVSMRTRRDGLVQGDFSPKNILVAKDRLVLLDHEVAHVGDRAFDLGFFMTHLVAKSVHLPEIGDPLRRGLLSFWQSYEHAATSLRASDPTLEARCCTHLICCLLARCLGRSPLEYLDARSHPRVLELARALAARPPSRVAQLAEALVARS